LLQYVLLGYIKLRKAVASTSLFFYTELVAFLCCCVWFVDDMLSWL